MPTRLKIVTSQLKNIFLKSNQQHLNYIILWFNFYPDSYKITYNIYQCNKYFNTHKSESYFTQKICHFLTCRDKKIPSSSSIFHHSQLKIITLLLRLPITIQSTSLINNLSISPLFKIKLSTRQKKIIIISTQTQNPRKFSFNLFLKSLHLTSICKINIIAIKMKRKYNQKEETKNKPRTRICKAFSLIKIKKSFRF